MARPKGSKNKVKTAKAAVDYAAMIAEKQAARDAIAEEIAAVTMNIEALKTELKEKKASLKAADKEVLKLEAKKAKAELKAAEDAKKSEAEDLVKKLLATGVSAEQIVEKLK